MWTHPVEKGNEPKEVPQTLLQGYPDPGLRQRQLTLAFLHRGPGHLRVATDSGVPGAPSPQPTQPSRGSALPAFSPPARSCQEGFAVRWPCLVQLDTTAACKRWFSFAGKLPFPSPLGSHSQNKVKKTTRITKTFRPTCAFYPSVPNVNPGCKNGCAVFPPVKWKDTFLCLKKKPSESKDLFGFSSTMRTEIRGFCTRTCSLA